LKLQGSPHHVSISEVLHGSDAVAELKLMHFSSI
jgi:hypothetical protein